jgi:hypothetical protein
MTALGQVDGIDQIESVRVFDSNSGILLSELPFSFNAVAGSNFAAEAAAQGLAPEGANWQRFFSEVLGDVSKGRLLTFVLDVKLKKETSLGILAEQLRNRGLLGTAAATNRDGAIDPDHVHFRILGTTPISIGPRLKPNIPRPEVGSRP